MRADVLFYFCFCFFVLSIERLTPQGLYSTSLGLEGGLLLFWSRSGGDKGGFCPLFLSGDQSAASVSSSVWEKARSHSIISIAWTHTRLLMTQPVGLQGLSVFWDVCYLCFLLFYSHLKTLRALCLYRSTVPLWIAVHSHHSWACQPSPGSNPVLCTLFKECGLCQAYAYKRFVFLLRYTSYYFFFLNLLKVGKLCAVIPLVASKVCALTVVFQSLPNLTSSLPR